jgi:hypothetical protein
MTNKPQRGRAPAGGAPQPPELPHEITPDDELPTPAPEDGAPLPDMPMSRDPLLSPGPVPVERRKPSD